MERYVERYVERDRAGKNVFSFFPKRMLSLFWNKKNKVSLSYPSPKSESIFSEYLSFFCASRENASNLGERNRRFLSPRLLFGGELFNVPNISLSLCSLQERKNGREIFGTLEKERPFKEESRVNKQGRK